MNVDLTEVQVSSHYTTCVIFSDTLVTRDCTFEVDYDRCGHSVKESGTCESVYKWERIAATNATISVDSTPNNRPGEFEKLVIGRIIIPLHSKENRHSELILFMRETLEKTQETLNNF